VAQLKSWVQGTAIISIFRNNDTGLLQYRAQHFHTGYVLSDGDWTHLYHLRDQRWLKRPPNSSITRSRPKYCVTCPEHVQTLIKFFLDNLATPVSAVQWGSSQAKREVEEALHALGFSLTEDGHMIHGVFPHLWRAMNVA
jgi:hypothetical protein